MSLVWGSVVAGVAANAIPQRGTLRGTVRVLDRDAWQGAEEIIRALVDEVGAATGRRRARSTTCAASRRWSTTRGRSPCCAPPPLETVGADAVVLSPQSMGGEDFGWFAERLPIALARLGTHGGGEPLDLHRGTFDVDERAIAIGVRLLARTALHALEADAGHPVGVGRPPPGRTDVHAPGDTAARRADEESHRG